MKRLIAVEFIRPLEGDDSQDLKDLILYLKKQQGRGVHIALFYASNLIFVYECIRWCCNHELSFDEIRKVNNVDRNDEDVLYLQYPLVRHLPKDK